MKNENDIVKLKEDIKKYIPVNEQEEKDKMYFLKFIDTFDDVLTRKNVFGHFTASAWVINEKKTKMVVVKHNIYNAYIYPGGHADGEKDLLAVAIKEIKEEIGIDAKPIFNDIFAISAAPTIGHIKHGQYVPAHIHFDVIYLLEASEAEELVKKEDENSDVKWINIEDSFNDEIVDFIRPVNQKIYQKIKSLWTNS